MKHLSRRQVIREPFPGEQRLVQLGKSTTKSNKVDAAPAVVRPTESVKKERSGKGEKKRKADGFTESQSSAKKPNSEAITKDTSAYSEKEQKARTLFVGNLFFKITEESVVRNFLKDEGDIASFRFGFDEKGIFKCMARVEFKTVEAAQKARELDGEILLGRMVSVECFEKSSKYAAFFRSGRIGQ